MRFTGTFLNSVVAKRIAIMLFLAVVIPTALITGLASTTIKKITFQSEHSRLVDVSQDYGLSAFANLTFARTALRQLSEELKLRLENHNLIQHSSAPIFDSVAIVSAARITTISGEAKYPAQTLQQAIAKIEIPSTKSILYVFKSQADNAVPSVVIAIPFHGIQTHNIVESEYLVGEINQSYLWGEKGDYPSDIHFCVYTRYFNEATLAPIFCNNSTTANAKNKSMAGKWSLFLKAEFQHQPWELVTEQLYNKKKQSDSFINNKRFVGLALLSLLFVGLMGLIHIRKTMVPLEKLIDGTRKIAQGKFEAVEVEGKSEFSELADSFNNMSSNIQRQMDTLETLSTLDRSIATKLDVDDLIQRIIGRVENLTKGATVAIFRVNEVTDTEIQCNVDISKHAQFDETRVCISPKEYDFLQSIQDGKFDQCHRQSDYCYQKKLCVAGAKYTWVFPVLWQGKLCSFLAIGQREAFDENAFYWVEIRKLAGRIAIAISAQAREDQLLIQAQYDALTGLPNRILLQDRLQQAMEHSDHTGQPFWLAFIDLDRFKFVNDSLGHSAGDQLLTEVAKRLSAIVEDTDTVARFGGDEFIIILQHQSDSHLRMDMLNQLIEASATPIDLEGKEIFMSASIGIAVYPTDGNDGDTLLRNADVAMYRAKELGKNNFQFFTQSMNKRVTDRLSLEMHLRRAIELNEFKLVYQPKVSLETHKIVGMEALIRWHSEALGFISPQQFIPLAEENGLIIPIGEWAMKTACAQTKAWHDMGFDQLRISVNLSARQFKQKDLVNSINDILQETGLNADALELELTESLVMNGVDESMKILHGIREAGVHLSVDDFGTGYSSLAYLKDLPLNTLKIDKSFTDGIINAHDKVPIVDSVILLAKNLGLKVVAEGVEHSYQARYLAAHDCDEIQGYYFSKPESPENFEAMLLSNKTLVLDEIL